MHVAACPPPPTTHLPTLQTIQPSVEFEVNYAPASLIEEINRGLTQAMAEERGESGMWGLAGDLEAAPGV